MRLVSTRKLVVYLVPVLLIGLFFGVYDVGRILEKSPTSIHVWRQADCASFAYMYYAKELPLLKPEIHNFISDDGTTGRTAGEFTGLYWFVGKLYSIIGFHEWIYRAVGLTLFLLAIWASFDLVSGISKDLVWGAIVAVFFATSPVLVFYSSAFLTNVPALCFTIFGWWFAYKQYCNGGLFWIGSLCCFALGGLLKIPALVSFIALLVWWSIEKLPILNTIVGTFRLPKIKHSLTVFISVFAIVAAWYGYVSYYVNSQQLGKYTFNNLWPLWEMESDQIEKAMKFALDVIIHQITSLPTFIALIALSLLCVVLGWRTKRSLLIFTFVLALGMAAYILMWFNALDGHDYYVINTLILFATIMVVAALILKEYHLINRLVQLLLSILMIWNIGYAANNFKMRYWKEFDTTIASSKFFGAKYEVEYWWYYGNNRSYEVYSEVADKLTTWGIQENDVIISLPDPSFCISLYLMNREGYSGMSCPIEKEAINARITKGAKYLVINDSLLHNQKELESFMHNPVGQFKSLSVYDLTH